MRGSKEEARELYEHCGFAGAIQVLTFGKDKVTSQLEEAWKRKTLMQMNAEVVGNINFHPARCRPFDHGNHNQKADVLLLIAILLTSSHNCRYPSGRGHRYAYFVLRLVLTG